MEKKNKSREKQELENEEKVLEKLKNKLHKRKIVFGRNVLIDVKSLDASFIASINPLKINNTINCSQILIDNNNQLRFTINESDSVYMIDSWDRINGMICIELSLKLGEQEGEANFLLKLNNKKKSFVLGRSMFVNALIDPNEENKNYIL